MKKKLKNKDLLTLLNLDTEEVWRVLKVAELLKVKRMAGQAEPVLPGKVLGMIFEKPSTRTRISFEVAMYQLGGMAIFLSKKDLQLERGETIADTARVLSRYVDGIMARTYAHRTIEELAEHASIPVINGLSDRYHPCQILGDLLSIYEKKRTLRGLNMVYLGDGNNVAHSLLFGAAKVGMNITLALPEGYDVLPEILEQAKEIAGGASEINISRDPKEASRGADVLYTDVWASMGQEEEHAKRLQDFQGFSLDGEKLKVAKGDCLVMHCLPAHRGEEITDEVIDGPNSIVFDQAENRLHIQKAILALLM